MQGAQLRASFYLARFVPPLAPGITIPRFSIGRVSLRPSKPLTGPDPGSQDGPTALRRCFDAGAMAVFGQT